MKCFSVAALLAVASGVAWAGPHREESFDEGWRFALGHGSDPDKDFRFLSGSFSAYGKAGTDAGPISLGFNDRAWRKVDLPHDWAVELPFDPKSDTLHGHKPVGPGFPETSVGWYRKAFTVPATDKGKHIELTFDGIYRDAQIFINGHYLVRNESGYIGATVPISDYLRYGHPNVVSVRVDASAFEGWFYEGAGIYRHTWIRKTNPLHFVRDGVALRPKVTKSGGMVEVEAELTNTGSKATSGSPTVTIKNAAGKTVGMAKGTTVTVAPGQTKVVKLACSVRNPKLWSPEAPNLYSAEVKIGEDVYSHEIGFRTIRWDKDLGFFLNGKPYFIQGTCNHQDHAGVGMAVPDALNAWRVKQLQSFGCNFYRTSHNPPTPELLEACNRLGMMVLNETRPFGSVGEYGSQLDRLVRRDRNHPSVIFWSIGNEEWGTQTSDESEAIARSMMRSIAKFDPTRKVTFGANVGAETTGINAAVDIRGFNYNWPGVDEYRRRRPDQPIHGSEVASTLTTRGEYETNSEKAYVNSYDIAKASWTSTAEYWWKAKLARPWYAGGFVWTGFDYRGEPTPYGWPNVSSHFGILDTCGFYKDLAYYYKAEWTKEKVLHLLPHWNWKGKEGQELDVWAYTNAASAELFLNGKSQGKLTREPGGQLKWKVKYEPGELHAIGYDTSGKESHRTVVRTTGAASQLQLTADRTSYLADGTDVAVIQVNGLDSLGAIDPIASNLIKFDIEGGAKIIGVGNGDPSSHEPDTMVPTQKSISFQSWKVAALPTWKGDDPSGQLKQWTANVEGANTGIQSISQNSGAVAVSKLVVDEPDDYTEITIGPIDDIGFIYLNGALLGKTNRWSDAHTFSVAGKLRKGENELIVFAWNNAGAGGFTGEASMASDPVNPSYSRSLFHGYAQVIVQFGKNPGKVLIRAEADGLQTAYLQLESKAKT